MALFTAGTIDKETETFQITTAEGKKIAEGYKRSTFLGGAGTWNTSFNTEDVEVMSVLIKVNNAQGPKITTKDALINHLESVYERLLYQRETLCDQTNQLTDTLSNVLPPYVQGLLEKDLAKKAEELNKVVRAITFLKSGEEEL